MAQNRLTRRAALAGTVASAASLPFLTRPHAAPAAAARAVYGAAVKADALATDTDYAAALARHCRLLVPEGALKWVDLRPGRTAFDFAASDRIADFAGRHGIGLRGHTLAWYGAMPAWTDAITTRAEAERVLTEHIETVVSRYRGRIASWDVVNEPTPEKPSRPGELRPFVWTRTLGADYIPIAFRAAAAADPKARLVLNEYDVEFVGERFTRRREILLGIARSLVDRGVPIHAIGLQGHLFADRALDWDGLQGFLREIRALGLDVLVTELDVVDQTLPGPVAARDAAVAETARAFLATIAEVAPPSAILTWGISDRYTWVPMYFKRGDGLPNRPLPLDADMRPKPLMTTIESFTRGAS